MRKLHYIGLFVVSWFVLTWTLMAQDVPTTIRIGLESVAKDATSIQIQSEANLAVGYFVEIGRAHV